MTIMTVMLDKFKYATKNSPKFPNFFKTKW